MCIILEEFIYEWSSYFLHILKMWSNENTVVENLKGMPITKGKLKKKDNKYRLPPFIRYKTIYFVNNATISQSVSDFSSIDFYYLRTKIKQIEGRKLTKEHKKYTLRKKSITNPLFGDEKILKCGGSTRRRESERGRRARTKWQNYKCKGYYPPTSHPQPNGGFIPSRAPSPLSVFN